MGWDKGVINPKFQAIDANGDPLSGGKVHTYESGTTTPKTTYSDRGLTSANANPVVLDSRGEASIYCSGLLKIILKDSDDTTIWTKDDMRVSESDSLADDDADTKIQVEETADEDKIRFDCGGAEQIRLEDGKLLPSTDDDISLGDSTHGFKPLHLAEQSAGTTTGANQMGIYAKALNGQSELYVREESSGDEVLLTDQGKTPLPRAYLAGLELSNAADADHDITIAVGEARDSGNAVNLILASALTKQIDATWAAGSDAGGLFSGTVGNTTWYHVFLIRKDSDGSIDAGFDTSVSAANIPTGYTEYRRIGSVLTDGSANILAFVQSGDRIYWSDPPGDVDEADQDNTKVARTLSVPSDVRTVAMLHVQAYDGNENMSMHLFPTDITDEGPFRGTPPYALLTPNAGVYGSCYTEILADTSSQIYSRGDGLNSTLSIATLGYIDRRGRDG